MTRSAVPADQVVEAYRTHGTVWKAAKALGLCGQSVWERLRHLGIQLPNRNWTSDEVEELRSLAQTCTISEMARRLGRPYAGVALKLSRMEIPASAPRKSRKVPRGAGFDKVSVARHMKALANWKGTFTRYCRANSLSVEVLVQAIQRDNLHWWDEYTRTHGTIPSRQCDYCNREFYPTTPRQHTCSRQCGSTRRADVSYFGGNRRNTIGLAERVCQLCSRQDAPGLSSHHMIGKDNDPENAMLIALCPGCHRLVGTLAGRAFVDTNEGWEALINLVMLRRSKGEVPMFYTTVEVERCTDEQALEWDEFAEMSVSNA